VQAADAAVRQYPDLAGVVVLHGTATLEETAYALNLTAKVRVPIVLVGSQRPASALSSDAGRNLVNAVRTAAAPEARGLGVLVCLNDEIHAARDVTKTSTARLQAFRSPDFGLLGHADGDAVVFYRKPLRQVAPDTEFDIRALDALPRVDIAYGYAGDDGAAVGAYVQAGARGIVVASLAPGVLTPGETEALKAAVSVGVVVMLSSRVGSGRVFPLSKTRQVGFLVADNLNPQKARVLLALALTKTANPDELRRIFATY
jgi:L-asparaginase